MKNKITLFFLAAVLSASLLPASAQNSIGERDAALRKMSSKGWEFELKAGLNIGGATPLGLPREIRHISSFDPKLNGTLEGTATKWFGEQRKWGVAAGIKIEAMRMSTGARVKNYHTEIIQDGDRVAGYYTGYDKTNYSSTNVTIPVTANYSFNDRWKVRAGMFVTYRVDGEFNGYVSDGYLRNGSPVGEKVVFSDGSSANYNFDDDLRRFNWGVQTGATWNAYRHFFLFGDLSYSFSNIFEHDFKTVTFALHPLYFNLGFGYRF